MKSLIKGTAATLVAGAGLAGAASAAEIFVTANISTSETWTANNTYNLQNQIYVLPGATLTIEAGTVVASDVTVNGGGALAVTKGAQIFVQGTKANPVIMTSKADVATWTGGDPTTGSWRVAANEWGNLTIMGAGYISENGTVGNVATPNASNVASMEGLIADFVGDTKVLYGGGNDDDDSGSVSYLSLRYGGRVVGLNTELNGLSLGGIGRGTDIHHVEIMNNVDDGIEVWGGKVNLKYISIWNIGDDSLDCDQGWRGKAQFAFIVQGYSAMANQGSGIGDNCFEMDGAEDSHWQPVTTSVIYNATVVGQPVSGDHATAWRDNARVQYRNCVFMDIGDDAVAFDNVDGDGANGYGHMGTLSWVDTWTTPYTATSAVNAPANPADFYTAQFSGRLAEITDSVFFRVADYTQADARGVFDMGNNNTKVLSTADADAPIMSITRGAPVMISTTSGTLTMLPVTTIDPRPKNEALTSVAAAPADGFFTPAFYRGAFEPNVAAWTSGWTASDAFGFTGGGDLFFDVCSGDGGDQMGCTDCPCSNNAPVGTIGGCLNPASTSARLLPEGVPSVAADTMRFEMSGGVPSSFAVLTSGGALAPTAPSNPCFGLNSGLPAANLDGLRCVVQGVQRHGARAIDANGNVGVTGAGWGPPNGPAGGLIAQGGFVSGQTRHYQVIYRVDALLGCMRGQQTSQAVTVTFLP